VKRTAHSLSNHRSKRGLRVRVRTTLRVGGGLRRVGGGGLRCVTAPVQTFGAVQATRRVSEQRRPACERAPAKQHDARRVSARKAFKHDAHPPTPARPPRPPRPPTPAHLCSSNLCAHSVRGTPCISNCVGRKRVGPAPSHRATGTPSAGARCWDSICRRRHHPAGPPGHLWPEQHCWPASQMCKLYRQSDGASQPSNHLDASQPSNHLDACLHWLQMLSSRGCTIAQ
jgi:hypothetical protein